MRDEIEDGMGFAGLVPTAAERRAEEIERRTTAICYRGFCYNVRSQHGVESLRSAIKRNGHE